MAPTVAYECRVNQFGNTAWRLWHHSDGTAAGTESLMHHASRVASLGRRAVCANFESSWFLTRWHAVHFWECLAHGCIYHTVMLLRPAGGQSDGCWSNSHVAWVHHQYWQCTPVNCSSWTQSARIVIGFALVVRTAVHATRDWGWLSTTAAVYTKLAATTAGIVAQSIDSSGSSQANWHWLQSRWTPGHTHTLCDQTTTAVIHLVTSRCSSHVHCIMAVKTPVALTTISYATRNSMRWFLIWNLLVTCMTATTAAHAKTAGTQQPQGAHP